MSRRRWYLVAVSAIGTHIVETSRPSDAADYALVRSFLERCFPGRVVASPLESFPPGGVVVAVWTSSERDGRRDASSFHEWALSVTA